MGAGAPLSDAERERILYTWNATAQDFLAEPTLHRLVESQAANTPDSLAVVCGEQQLSYGELDRRANQLAHHLRTLGVGPENIVALLLPRTPDFVIAALAVLKADAAYLPLDAAYPAERLAFMLADAHAPVLLTHTDLLPLVPAFAGHSLTLDTAWPTIGAQPATPPPSCATADHLAYLIYTSGSTGQPKGVAVHHGGVGNLVAWHQQCYALTQQDRTSLLASLAFDAAVWELWPTLASGASLHLPPDALRAAPDALAAWLGDQRITIAFLPTPLAEAILTGPIAATLPLRALLTGGDQLHTHNLRDLPYPLVNHYGPTENSVVTTCATVPVDSTALPPIGYPIANTTVYLLDAEMQPVPVGIVGELYTGGSGLARGYHDRPALTAEKFVPDPFSRGATSATGARLYRTGDLARYREDGQIEFVGRIDDQVKIRGYRIELGEIEAVLLRHAVIEQAVVLVQIDQSTAGEHPVQRLIGYVVKRQPADNDEALRSELRSFLQTQLPDYMVPATILVLDVMPLTPNGKIDRKALSALDWAEASRRRTVVAPRTPLEATVAHIWKESLRLAQISIDDNFFDLGGNSLGATQIVSRVQKAFKIHITVRDVLAAPTVEALVRDLLAHEQQPGQLDRVAAALQRVWSMSPEERQRMLEQKKAK